MVVNEYYIVSANYTMDCINNILDFEINNNTSLCPICNNNFKITTDAELGEIICDICGIVLSEEKKFPLHPRIYQEMIASNHANTTINTELQHYDRKSILCNIEYSTIIGRSNVDAAGKKISDSIQNKIDRLRIWDHRTRYINSKDRNLKYAFEELNNIKHKLGLSCAIVEKSFYFYKKASSLGLLLGRTTEGILCASIYLACKELETPKTMKEISDITNVKIKSISKYSRILIFELDLKTIPVINPIKCIVKIANNLSLEEKTKHKAIKLMKEIMKQEIHVGKNPLAIAASTIYAVCKGLENEDKTQVEIAKSAGISAVVIRDRYNDIINKVDLDQKII